MLQEEQIEKIENSGKTKKIIKTSTGMILIFVAVVLFFGGALSYWYYNDPNSYDSSKDSTQVATTVNSNTNASNTNVNGNANINANTNSSSATADWQTYTSSTYGFSIKYPKGLSSEVTDSGKNIAFETSKDKTDYDSCIKKGTSECIKSSQLIIAIDETVGTPNGDNISSSLNEIVANRITYSQLVNNSVKTTLGQQPACEGVTIGMLTSYDMISKFGSHIYDLRINCDSAVKDVTSTNALNECKSVIGADQLNMLSTFQFTK